MHTVQEIGGYLDEFAPAELAEDWDNVGLLVGHPQRPAKRIMVCLTVTPESAAEAVSQKADLVVTHHPLPFRPLRRITTETVPGQLLLQLIEAGVAVISPHTAFDSAQLGINQRLAEGIGLSQIRPLLATDDNCQLGSGRWGRFPEVRSLTVITDRLKEFLGVEHTRCVGDPGSQIATAAVACGSAGQFLKDAQAAGCGLLVTGETTFHTCLEAAATNVCLLLPGHYASERFAVEQLATVLQLQFRDLDVWASAEESDPIWQA
jgi:dinuclear metal center YbgI/SA1388 family protein